MDFLDSSQIIFLAGFIGFIVIMLLLDLFVFHRKAHVVSTGEALGWSIFWIALAMAFNVIVYFHFGRDKALEFLTGYIIEETLSVDNLFVFLMIFSHFKVPRADLHRVLFWGILGAIILRGVMIFIGAGLVSRFEWVLYVFGVFLLYASVKMATHKGGEEVDLEDSALLRFLKKRIRITTEYHGERFFIIKEGVRWATPLVPVLVLVESSDVMFAVDSIPAIFAVTTDPVIVFTSNMFAILGLRSLFFLLAGVMSRFVYLEKGLAVILAFVGAKILVAHFLKIPTVLSLGVIAAVLAISVIASIVKERRG